MSLNPKAFGLSAGIIWGITCLIMALVSGTGYGLGLVHGLGSIYIGYGPGIVGSILGAIYGFLDGFIGGYIFVWIYNIIDTK